MAIIRPGGVVLCRGVMSLPPISHWAQASLAGPPFRDCTTPNHAQPGSDFVQLCRR
eukprot:CAMPEP_0197890622 /NCGR_PEP_ID=MMETSP1439-20131203/27119_1 /TAXON_ID=66791 /ORGANISM="Gonyaulax spinifera, Strain CCMP409" /LENGTH=55 /DNA_ID=CAMNT_0043510675 /DNA_START=13 /DNA_END=176 /DNA_ORIENTATION=+